jgi:folylpolyglutamate synthase/dihydropteroate synthase
VDNKWIKEENNALIENACVAQAALRCLGLDSPCLRNFHWPCRLEHFLYEDQTLLLDGCHNRESVQLCLQTVRCLYPNKEIYVLFGAGMEKNVDAMVHEVFTHADRFVHMNHIIEMLILTQDCAFVFLLE